MFNKVGSFMNITILFPPRIKIVTAFEFLHSSITNILSLVVPKQSSRTSPAYPSLSAVNSSNLGTIRPPVAMAMSCNKFRYLIGQYRMLITPALQKYHSSQEMVNLPQSLGLPPSAQQAAPFVKVDG